MPDKPNDQLQNEFNQWAEQGRGEEMEQHHLSIAEQTIRLMQLQPGDRVLDLGCGTGWATRMMASLLAQPTQAQPQHAAMGAPAASGLVVGIDISDEMIRRARAQSRDFDNVLFVWGAADQLPWEENYFHKVLSIESFYYYPDQERVLAELVRVMAPLARLYILINLYRDNPYSLRWVDELKVPVHARSEAEYIELLRRHTFEQVEAHRIPDLTPTPDTYQGKWFRNAEELREFKRLGALLLTARKPDFMSPPRAHELL